MRTAEGIIPHITLTYICKLQMWSSDDLIVTASEGRLSSSPSGFYAGFLSTSYQSNSGDQPAARALWSALAPVLWFFSLWERARGLLTVQSPKGNNILCKTKDSELSKQACKEQKSGLYTSIRSSLRFITYWKNPTETSEVLLSVNISLQIFLTTHFPLSFFPMIFLQLFFFFSQGRSSY